MFLFKTNIKIEEPEYLNSSNKDEFLICSQGENPSIITESYFSKNEESVIENEPPLQVESEGEDELFKFNTLCLLHFLKLFPRHFYFSPFGFLFFFRLFIKFFSFL